MAATFRYACICEQAITKTGLIIKSQHSPVIDETTHKRNSADIRDRRYGMPNRRSLFRSWLLLEGAISIFSLACEIEFFQHTESVIMQSRDGARQCKFR